MTKPSSTPVKHASVEVATHICKMTVDFERDVEHDYHIIYGCDVHGPKNHYGPYCGCIPFPLDVSMLSLLPDGTFPPMGAYRGHPEMLPLQLPVLLRLHLQPPIDG